MSTEAGEEGRRRDSTDSTPSLVTLSCLGVLGAETRNAKESYIKRHRKVSLDVRKPGHQPLGIRKEDFKLLQIQKKAWGEKAYQITKLIGLENSQIVRGVSCLGGSPWESWEWTGRVVAFHDLKKENKIKIGGLPNQKRLFLC